MAQQVKYPGSRAMANGSHGLLARAYYRIKPFVPKSLRWMIRRSRIPGIMKRSGDVWPINRAAGGMPVGWGGWPGDKKFALVITHDVESKEGLRNVRRLAELETSHGLRSSFNFIPEGPYEDPVELREWLGANQFEVGVHDLNHDGRLYGSREIFSEKARHINHYLDKWGAVGFRSGFMLHQLDWLHDLNILYDASTFDTDPFEPQPDGSATIFPFYMKSPVGARNAGYVELSYTLPQDSTLFLLLGESTPEIWKEKLAWIREHGGLALVNIHPDYIDFSEKGKLSSGTHYPVSIVREFLDHIHQEYSGLFWNPLARELAQWYRDGLSRADDTVRQATPQIPSVP